MREIGFQSKVLSYLNSLPKCMAENVSGNARQSGRADINACYKGYCIKIELKSEDNADYEVTKQQGLYLKRWALAGAITLSTRKLEDVELLITAIDVKEEVMKFKEGMTEKQKVEALERIVLLHSIIYYEFDSNLISDKRYDKLARLLAKKVAKHGTKKIQKTQYGYVFYDFDGSTGFDLMGRLKKKDKAYLSHLAQHMLELEKRGK